MNNLLEKAPKGRQSTAGGETPGKMGDMQAPKGRRNTGRGKTPATGHGLVCWWRYCRGFTPACIPSPLRGFPRVLLTGGCTPRLYSVAPSGLSLRSVYQGLYPRLYSAAPFAAFSTVQVELFPILSNFFRYAADHSLSFSRAGYAQPRFTSATLIPTVSSRARAGYARE